MLKMDKIREKISNIKEKLSTNDKQLANKAIKQTELNGFGLRQVELRAYQLEGIQWMINRYRAGLGFILADEMGLGKTCQTISLLVYIYGHKIKRKPSLILCPLSVIANWQDELSRFAPSIKYVSYRGTKDERAELRLSITDDVNVVLTTYETCLSDEEFLSRFDWHTVTVDEAHRLKNRKSQLHQALLQMNFDHQFLLTGTPVQNNLEELYSLLCFVAPFTFKWTDMEDFVDAYRDVSDAGQSNDIADILSPFLLRRIKSEVVKDLPKKSEVVLYHRLSALQRKYYKAILKKDLEAFENWDKTKKTRLRNVLMQLRKCVGHPYLFDGVEPEPFELGEHLVEASGKLVVIDQLLAHLKDGGHKVLLFSQMTRMLDILQDYLGYRGYTYERLDGSVRAEERFLAVRNFNKDDETFVFLLSTRAGGQGLNLTSADTVIFVDSDFNPQNDLQAAARAHRIGQLRNVKIIRLIGRSTVEEIVLRRAEDKLRLTNAVIVPGQSTSDQGVAGCDDQLEDIIKFGLDKLFQDDDTPDDIDFTAILGPTVSGVWQLEGAAAVVSAEEEDDTEVSEVNDMYNFEGEDYRGKKDPSAADQKAFDDLVAATRAMASEMTDVRTRRNKQATATLLAGLPELPTRKPRKQLTPEQLEERKKKRAENAALRAKQEEEEELQRAQAKKEKRLENWKKNDYTSKNIDLPTDDNDDDDNNDDDSSLAIRSDDDDDGENEVKEGIHYVVGDVTHPQNTNDKDAVVVHCVDDSGRWGQGGLFTAINNRSLQPEQAYTLAGKMRDLALGDVHVIPIDDMQSRQIGHDVLSLIVAQHRDKNNYLSGIKMSALTYALRKLYVYAKAHNASIHLPRIGHNTPSFNWYGTERLIKKHLASRGIPTYVYYYPRGGIAKRKHPTNGTPNSKAKRTAAEPGCSSTASPHAAPSVDHLPNFFQGVSVYFHNVPADIAKTTRRHVVAYDGDVHDTLQGDTTHVVLDNGCCNIPSELKSHPRVEDGNVKFVSIKWISECLAKKKQVKIDEFLVSK